MKVFRTRMCCTSKTPWMLQPLCCLTQISSLKMALWHWRVSSEHKYLQCKHRRRRVVPFQSDICLSPHSVCRLSEECEYFAYGLSSSGSDWVTIHFIKADDLTKLPDVLERVKFSCLAWTHDAKGIFYNSYPRQEGKTDGELQPAFIGKTYK